MYLSHRGCQSGLHRAAVSASCGSGQVKVVLTSHRLTHCKSQRRRPRWRTVRLLRWWVKCDPSQPTEGPGLGKRREKKKNHNCGSSQVQPEWLSSGVRYISSARTPPQTQIILCTYSCGPTLIPVRQTKVSFNGICFVQGLCKCLLLTPEVQHISDRNFSQYQWSFSLCYLSHTILLDT